jgi:hypothetical protein
MIEPDSRRYGGALALSGVVKAENFVTISAQYLNDIAQLCRAIAKRFAYDLYKFVKVMTRVVLIAWLLVCVPVSILLLVP